MQIFNVQIRHRLRLAVQAVVEVAIYSVRRLAVVRAIVQLRQTVRFLGTRVLVRVLLVQQLVRRILVILILLVLLLLVRQVGVEQGQRISSE